MMSEFLIYILSVIGTIVFLLLAFIGIYIILILRDVRKIVSRVDQISELTKNIATVPLYAILGYMKNNKWLKAVIRKIKEQTNEKEG